jgi:hypothetical protein
MLPDGIVVTVGRLPSVPEMRGGSAVIQYRADATAFVEHRVAAVAGQIEVERLVRFLLAIAVDKDGDRIRRLAEGVLIGATQYA